jgi:23S rRNA pseudouridine1911/1915/1917 synthase
LDDLKEQPEELDDIREGPLDEGTLKEEPEAKVITLDDSYPKRRLDALLSLLFPEYSRASMERAISAGMALLDGTRVLPSTIFKTGQVLTFIPPKPKDLYPTPDKTIPLDIIYQDTDIIIINKAPNLTMHPGFGTENMPTLAGALLGHFPEISEIGEISRPGIIHRLDKDTSGVLVVAKSKLAWECLTSAFESRETSKVYLAFVAGIPPTTGVIEHQIGRHPVQRHMMATVLSGGRSAKTDYRVIRSFPKVEVSLVSLRLFTGRTHQARVHMVSEGHPIVGDKTYGVKPSAQFRKHPSLIPLIKRQFLHARRLSIPHPKKGLMVFSAPWPSDFVEFYKELARLEDSE